MMDDGRRFMQRRVIDIRGIVQGVGFRPFVHALASRLQLTGFVLNHAGGVAIEVEGDLDRLEQFEHELTESAPPLARIESIGTRQVALAGTSAFHIADSCVEGIASLAMSPDVATCDDCLRELFDPADRRFRYPFINCTACGPRLTIVTGSPYDRERTTMAPFVMCADCRAEYLNPANRRFHAEPIACAVCGPRLEVRLATGSALDVDPIEAAVEAIAGGRIVALKGIGGFHLACDAGNAAAVARLRRRKHRDDKPFAVMVPGLAAAASLTDLGTAGDAILRSPARPIVLLPKRPGIAVADAVAPDSTHLGVMLPYAPLHHLLMAQLGDRAVVMTSGNRSDEPIATENADAIERLRDIADVFVVHNRPIHVRCDDSVVRQAGALPIPIRRSRGHAPAPIALPVSCAEPMLAVGGQLKNTFALGRGRQAVVSHHLGDLDDLRAFEAFERDVALYEHTFAIDPRIVAHDMHPDYASTRFALGRTAVTHIAVQHHHAHLAACMAEHQLTNPVIGVIWDGAGWGPDACVWGGEILVGDYMAVERVAHLRYVPQPGGDAAAREPWRMAVAHLLDAGLDDDGLVASSIDAARRSAVRQMINRRFHSPLTSSAGRLFDAVAALCGAHEVSTYEGQAAMRLEALAEQANPDVAYPFDVAPHARPLTVDTRPLIRAVNADRLAGVEPALIARRFHSSLTEIVTSVCLGIRRSTGLSDVVLSGGVFANALLTVEVTKAMAAEGFNVYRHRTVPPGDGGLSLGQLAVAAARISPS
jgi:hydrogenase maturation protein HypF